MIKLNKKMFIALVVISLSFDSSVTSKSLDDHKTIDGTTQEEAGNHEIREKRSRRDINEIKDINEVIENSEEIPVIPSWHPTEIDIENMNPRAFYLLVQKIKQLQNNDPYCMKTHRFGRNYNLDLVDEQQNSGLLKKSVPFKPRLGKRRNLCE